MEYSMVNELSRLFYTHKSDQTMLVVWLSQLVLNLKPGKFDPGHNSATRTLFQNYLAELFGCNVADAWEIAEKWATTLPLYASSVGDAGACSSSGLPMVYQEDAISHTV